MNQVNEFLSRKSQNYDKIDKFRAFRIYEKYKNKFQTKPIIHIVGTNGKGSTGRFLTQLLENLNFKVGHFTSPHIFSFNERFYFNKNIASDGALQKAHNELKSILQDDLEKLSYFEYATFLAAILFKECDFLIFEAGLGGEYDATSVFEKSLSIFTKIDFDHMQILGDKIEQIARTKLKVMAAEAVILKEQNVKVLTLAKKIACLKHTNLHLADFPQEKALKLTFETYCNHFALAQFLKQNLSLALKALEILVGKNKTLKALSNLQALNLAGRCQKISDNLFVDVGHNALAARALCETFKNEKVILVYNSFFDKDVCEILRILKPIIDTIRVYDYPSQRETVGSRIFSIAKNLGIECGNFTHLSQKKTLVFGSFVLVENFLKEYCGKK